MSFTFVCLHERDPPTWWPPVHAGWVLIACLRLVILRQGVLQVAAVFVCFMLASPLVGVPATVDLVMTRVCLGPHWAVCWVTVSVPAKYVVLHCRWILSHNSSWPQTTFGQLSYRGTCTHSRPHTRAHMHICAHTRAIQPGNICQRRSSWKTATCDLRVVSWWAFTTYTCTYGKCVSIVFPFMWCICVMHLCDEFVWCIYVVHSYDVFTWCIYVMHLCDASVWCIYVMHLRDVFV